MYNDAFLQKKLEQRKEQNALRQLKIPAGKIDFCSNDYLGIVHNNLLNKKIDPVLKQVQQVQDYWQAIIV